MYKMLLALGMNWSTGVLLGGGPVCVHCKSSDTAQCHQCLLTFPTHSRDHCISPSKLSKTFHYLVWAPPPTFQ